MELLKDDRVHQGGEHAARHGELQRTTPLLRDHPRHHFILVGELRDRRRDVERDRPSRGTSWKLADSMASSRSFVARPPSAEARRPGDRRRLGGAPRPLRDRTDIRDVHDGRLVARLPNADLVRSVAWAPDGELLATGEYDGNGQLWSTQTWKRVGPALEGHERRLLELEFSPDGSLLSSSGADGTVRLWDVATRRAVGSPLKVEEDNVFVATAFAPSGNHVFAASGERRAVRWNVSPAAWKRHACRVAGRELTRQEWKEALPDRPYRSVCAAG